MVDRKYPCPIDYCVWQGKKVSGGRGSIVKGLMYRTAGGSDGCFNFQRRARKLLVSVDQHQLIQVECDVVPTQLVS